VKANYHTGLSQPDVFSFGNLIGETGDAPTPMKVSAADLASVKRVLNATAGVESPQDVNRDGKVNALDLGVIKRNLNQSLSPFAATVAFSPLDAGRARNPARLVLRPRFRPHPPPGGRPARVRPSGERRRPAAATCGLWRRST
jgi:hypothetical protein